MPFWNSRATFIYLFRTKKCMRVLRKEYRRLLTYSRLACMSQLYSFGEEGVPYRDLKAEFGLEDNLLGPQLLWLKSNKYIRPKEESLDKESIAVYYITKEGIVAYEKVLEWLKSLQPEIALKNG